MKLKTYNSEIVSQPKNDICALEGFTFKQAMNLLLIDNPETNDCDFKFVGVDGIDYFKCNKGDAFRVVHDNNNTPLFNFREKLFSSKTKIYKGKDDKDILATITPKNSTVAIKFSVEFFNQATEKTEILDMNCDGFYGSCGIFQGKEKEGSPMVAKIVEIMDANSFLLETESRYSIEMAANVDNALIIALAVFFAKMNIGSRDKRNHYH